MNVDTIKYWCGWWDSNPHPIKDGFLDRCVSPFAPQPHYKLCTPRRNRTLIMTSVVSYSNPLNYRGIYLLLVIQTEIYINIFVGITGFEPIISASEANVLTNYTTYPNNTSILRLVTHNPCHFRGLLVFLDR